MRKLMICVGLFALTACAQTREPSPVSMQSSNDKALSCVDITLLYKANTSAAAEKILKNINDDENDMWRFLLWPGLVDSKNADGIEGNALLDRNNYLKEALLAKGCDTSHLPAQPDRYK